MYEAEVPLPIPEVPDQPVAPPNKKHITMLIAGGIFIILLMLVIIFVPKKQSPEDAVGNSVDNPGAAGELNPYLERIKRLEGELKEADPTKQELSLPPVDMKISLD